MTATTEVWPYDDAVQDHWISEKHRIPVVSTPYPSWRYHVALVVNDNERLWPAVEPTEAEAAQLGSYLDYWLTKFYRPSYIEQMRRRPFDIDGGTVTRTFAKRPDGTWAYRQDTWTMGPTMAPDFRDPKQCHTLVELLDTRVETLLTEKWAAWKADRPEVFP